MTMPATSGTRPTVPSADVADDPSLASLMTTDVRTDLLRRLARRAR